MDKKLKLYAPCSNSWDKMEASGQNRFCQQCSKEVIDFTSMTDEELIGYFRQHKTACGKILPSQLGIIMNEPKAVRFSFPFIKKIAATVFAFFTFKAIASKPAHKQVEITQQPFQQKQKPEDSVKISIITKHNNGSPVGNVDVFFNKAWMGVTDSSGQLVLSPEIINKGKSYVLSFTHRLYSIGSKSYHPSMGNTSYTILIAPINFELLYVQGGIGFDDISVDLSNLKYDYTKNGFTDEDKATFSTLAYILRSNPEVPIDLRGSANDPKKLQTLKQRQNAIKKWMVDKEGIDPNRLKIKSTKSDTLQDNFIRFEVCVGY